MTFELTVLGSSSALPTSERYPTAHVLNVHERFFLIDCGEGTQMQLRKSKIKFGRINNIFISHLHGDHVFGLFGLLSTFNLLGRKNPLHIYAHPDMENILVFFREHFAEDLFFKIELHPLVKREVKIIYEDRVVWVYAFPLKHRVPAFGFLFKEKFRPLNIRKDLVEKYQFSIKQIQAVKAGEDITNDSGDLLRNELLTEPPYYPRSFAYCSDTSYYEKNVEILRNIDLLYHEATFLDPDKDLAKLTGHSTALQAAKLAAKAGVRELIIGHFSNRYKQTSAFLREACAIFPATKIAEELKTYTIELRREKRISH